MHAHTHAFTRAPLKMYISQTKSVGLKREATWHALAIVIDKISKMVARVKKKKAGDPTVIRHPPTRSLLPPSAMPAAAVPEEESDVGALINQQGCGHLYEVRILQS